MISDLSTQPLPPDIEYQYEGFIEMGHKKVWVYYNHYSNKYVVNVINPHTVWPKGGTWIEIIKQSPVAELEFMEQERKKKNRKLKENQIKLKF